MIRTDLPTLTPSHAGWLEYCFRCGYSTWHPTHNPERECYRDENGHVVCTDCAKEAK